MKLAPPLWLAPALLIATAAIAQQPSPHPASIAQKVSLHIDSKPVGDALYEFGQQSGLSVMIQSAIGQGLVSPRLYGEFTPEAALKQLLAHTGLHYEYLDAKTVAVLGPPTITKTSARKIGADATELRPERESATDSPPSPVRVASSDDRETGNSIEGDESGRGRTKLEEVVVTGSHIRGEEPIGSRVIVIDHEEIEKSGQTRLEDFMATLPQNFAGSASEISNTDIQAANSNQNKGTTVDLRGLGADTTLILINGRRQPTGGLLGDFTDISTIATSAIDRIEILTDGASAIYGSDAVAGVVNFVLKKNYDGLETQAHYGRLNDASDEIQLSQLIGKSWSTGNILFGYQFYRRHPMPNSSIPYLADNGNLTRFGGSDFRVAGAAPGDIYDPNTFQPAYAIPAGQNGRSLTANQLLPGQINYEDTRGWSWLPQQELNSAFLNLTQTVGDGWEVFAEGHWARREMKSAFGLGNFVVVPPTNPFYADPFGTGGPLFVAYDFTKDFGGVVAQGTVDSYAGTFGATGQLAHDWRVTMSYSYGQERNIYKQPFLDSAAVDATIADTNPATALNVMGDGTGNNPATINLLRGEQVARGTSTLNSANVIADGPLFQLPAGMVRLAIGSDYRDEGIKDAMNSAQSGFSGTLFSLYQPTSANRRVFAGFGELAMPLLGSPSDRGANRLEMSLAGRYEHYSDFGNTFNPKVGLSWHPMESLKVRGTWGTSFRAPRFSETNLGISPLVYNSFDLPDPKSPSGTTSVLSISGANPALKEEKAHVWTAGLDFAPQEIEGFKSSLTYFDINYRNKITTALSALAQVLQQEGRWTSIITRNPTQAQIDQICQSPAFSGSNCANIGAIIDFRLLNLAVLRVRGVDADISQTLRLPLGQLRLGVNGTYTSTYRQAVTDDAPEFSVDNTVGYPLKLKLRGSVSWSYVGWSANAFVNYANSYTNPGGTPDRVDSFTTVDLTAGYQFDADRGWLSNLKFSVSAINVFDKLPPFVNVQGGLDPANASVFGRTVGVQLAKGW